MMLSCVGVAASVAVGAPSSVALVEVVAAADSVMAGVGVLAPLNALQPSAVITRKMRGIHLRVCFMERSIADRRNRTLRAFILRIITDRNRLSSQKLGDWY